MKIKTFLTGQSFVLLGIWQLVGTAALIDGRALWIYALLFVILLALFIRDRSTLPSRADWTIRRQGSSLLRLHEKSEWIWILQLHKPGRALNISFYFPTSRLFRSSHLHQNLDAGISEYELTQEVTGFVLGHDKLGSAY